MIYSENARPQQRHSSAPRKKRAKLRSLLVQLNIGSDSDDSDVDVGTSPSGQSLDPAKPWLKDFRLYLDTTEAVPDSMDAVQWWGVSSYFDSILYLLTK